MLLNELPFKSCGVYVITTQDGKQYVGSTKNIRARCKQHITELKRGTHPNASLCESFAIYGEVGIDFKIELLCSKKILENLRTARNPPNRRAA